MPYLTPDANPASLTCRVLFIPDDRDWLAIVNGALIPLTKAYNFEQFGSVTPEQTAQRFSEMLEKFAYRIGTCRVIGEMILWAGGVSPDENWLICDGRSLSVTDYPDLYVVIGTTYGSSGAGFFNLPDMRDKIPMGVGSRTRGTTLGEDTHTLTTGEMPAHTHSEGTTTPTAVVVGEIPAVGITSALGVTGSAGLGGAHNNIQPSLVVNYLIVAKA